MPEVPSPTSIGPALRMPPHQASAEQVQPPSDAELQRIDSYWRTANYLAASAKGHLLAGRGPKHSKGNKPIQKTKTNTKTGALTINQRTEGE